MKQQIPKDLRTNFVGSLSILLLMFWLPGCKGCPPDQLPQLHAIKIETQKLDKVNLILENSASMGPYYKSDEFKTNLSNFITNLAEISSNLTFHVSDSRATLTSFSPTTDEALKKIKYGFQTGGNSPLDELLFNLIEKSKSDSSINILVTDLIIDDPNLNYKAQISTLQARIHNKFIEAKKNNLASIIYRFEAKYSGMYFTSKNDEAYEIDQKRPYFFWVIGPAEKMNRLGLEIENKMKDSIFDAVYVGIRPTFGEPFLFEYSGANGCNTFMKYAKDSSKVLEYNIKKNMDSIQFCMGINIGEMPKGMIKSSSGLKDILKADNKLGRVVIDYFSQNEFLKGDHLQNKDKSITSQFNHFFLIKVAEISNLNSYTIPFQINFESTKNFDSFSTNDDTDKEGLTNKTFGLLQFVHGMLEAYDDSKINLLTININ